MMIAFFNVNVDVEHVSISNTCNTPHVHSNTLVLVSIVVVVT